MISFNHLILMDYTHTVKMMIISFSANETRLAFTNTSLCKLEQVDHFVNQFLLYNLTLQLHSIYAVMH